MRDTLNADSALEDQAMAVGREGPAPGLEPPIVSSACRSPEHSRAVGGARASKHTEGAAFDIAMANHYPAAFEAAARAVGFRSFGT